MVSTFAQITNVQKYPKWHGICNRTDISVKNALTNRWIEILASFMRINYFPEYSQRLHKNLLDSTTRFGLTLDDLIKRLVPSSPTTQKADLGEAVCCLSFERIFGLKVPYYKWANKSHIEMPEHGIDVLAFRFEDNPFNDVLFLTEAKWRADTNSLLNIIKNKKRGIILKLSNFTDLNICDELNLLLKRIENNPEQNELYARIYDFFDRFVEHPKRICNVTFFLVDLNIDIDKCVEALNPLKNLQRELKSFNHLINDLSIVTEDVFKVINE